MRYLILHINCPDQRGIIAQFTGILYDPETKTNPSIKSGFFEAKSIPTRQPCEWPTMIIFFFIPSRALQLRKLTSNSR